MVGRPVLRSEEGFSEHQLKVLLSALLLTCCAQHK